MTIVACPHCGKKISSLAPICDHCGHHGGEAQAEDLRRFRERRLRDRIYRLNMATYAVMTAVIVAFAWYWIATAGFTVPLDSNGPLYLMAAGAVAYLAVRVLLFMARRQQKADRRSG